MTIKSASDLNFCDRGPLRVTGVFKKKKKKKKLILSERKQKKVSPKTAQHFSRASVWKPVWLSSTARSYKILFNGKKRKKN
jgi:hypothetical protein